MRTIPEVQEQIHYTELAISDIVNNGNQIITNPLEKKEALAFLKDKLKDLKQEEKDIKSVHLLFDEMIDIAHNGI